MKAYSLVIFYLTAFSLVLLNPPSGFTKTLYVNSSSNLRSALSQARTGDEILVASGTYTGSFPMTKNSGTATSPIILHAEQRHKSIIQGNGDLLDTNNQGFIVKKSHWNIDGFLLKNHWNPIDISSSEATNIEIRHNILYDFGANGIHLYGTSGHSIHHNVVALSPTVAGSNSYAGIKINKNSLNNMVENNIVYSITNDGHQCGDAGGCEVGDKRGYGILVHASSSNTLRGNLVMDAAKGTVRIMHTPKDAYPANYNRIEDNIAAFNEGGAFGASDSGASYNTFLNNLIYGTYYSGWSAKGNVPGYNIFQHNTIIVTPFSRLGAMLNRNDKGEASRYTTVKDNLFYSDDPNGRNQYLWRVDNWRDAIQESDNNLFWRPGTQSTWNKGVVSGSRDIMQQPVFVNKAHGDFTLAANSPGKGKASDGKDIGASFNAYLKKAWMRNVLALPTQQKTTTGQSLSFDTSSAHQYQVYVYIPDSTPFRGIETFSIEGNPIKRDYKNIIERGWVGAAPQRWIYLGTHENNGALDISWTQTEAANTIFIRQLPTPSEAYSWISSTREATLLPAPTTSTLTLTNN
jgi:hypothetical protein